jgi:hypothetical protein
LDNGTGTIAGRIIDASTKKPVAQVVVTFTSPALPGELDTISDASGDYTCGDLPLGTYTLRAETFDYKPYTRGHINLESSTPITVNFEMLPTHLDAKPEGAP